MKGRIRNIVKDRFFGFISVRDTVGTMTEYFFHRDDYQGDWKELEREVLLPKGQVWVEFDEGNGIKGLRASNVRRAE